MQLYRNLVKPPENSYYQSMGRLFTAFSDTVTLRIEKCHRKMKQYISISNEDLRNVYNKLCLYWEAQKTRYISELAQAMIWPTHSTKLALYVAVSSKVYFYILGKILEQ